MPIIVGEAGANRTVTSITVGDGGANRIIREVWVGDGGANRLVFAAINLLGLDPSQAIAAPGTATATYTLTSGGLEQATGLSDNTWMLAGSGGDYEARATLNSGALSSGTTGTWLSLGTTRAWSVTRSGAAGVSSANLTVEIRLASSGAVLATAPVVLTAELA